MSLRETLNTIRSAPESPNEEAVKLKIIAPILRDLGWDPFGTDVLYEHSVGGGEGGSVDIALRGPRDLVALIEAKAPGIDLKKHVSQVLRYAHYEGVDICVLTNGLEWWLYLPLDKGAPEKRRFTTLNIKDDPIEQLADDLETFLGEKTLVDGQSQKRAKQVLKASRQAAFLGAELPTVWKTMLDGPDDDLIELVRQRTYEKVNLRPGRRQVTAMLKGSPVPPVVSDGSVPPLPKPPSSKSGFTRGRGEGDPASFRLGNGPIIQVESGIDLFIQVIKALHKLYGNDLVNQMLSNTLWFSYDANRFSRPMRLDPLKLYMNKNLNIKVFITRLHRVLEFMGYPSSYLRVYNEEGNEIK